ncbi:MAG: iron chaperone [Flavobacteriales bacterium]
MHPDIQAHIAQFPPHTQQQLKELHAYIIAQMPELSQKISYGIPTFQRDAKNFIHYAGYSKHIGLYPGARAIAFFSDEFKTKGYKFSKGAVQFPLNAQLPYDLIARILHYLQKK